MAKKRSTKRQRVGLQRAMHAVMRAIDRAKDLATGESWRRLHRMESEAATVMRKKAKLTRKMTEKLMKQAGMTPAQIAAAKQRASR